jgi:flagellar protein FliT
MEKNTSIILEYESLATLMTQMLHAAKLQDWDKVSDLELFYQAKMQQIKTQELTLKLNKVDQARKLAIIKEILKNDHEIKSLIHPKMDELSKLMRGGQNKAKLNRTYGI